MKKISSITGLGFLVLIVASPLIAIPGSWKQGILVLCGLVIIVLSFLIRKELHKVLRIFHGIEEERADTYVENNPQ